MAAGFERDIEARAREIPESPAFRVRNRVDFCMRPAGVLVPAFSEDHSVANKNRSYQRVRADGFCSAGRQFQRPGHVFFILKRMHKKNPENRISVFRALFATKRIRRLPPVSGRGIVL